MTTTRRGLGFAEGTTHKVTQNHMVYGVPGDTGVMPEIPKSPWMPRPKKDKQTEGPVRMSPRNPRFGKLSMEEKGKAITFETNDEEEEWQCRTVRVCWTKILMSSHPCRTPTYNA